MRRLLPHILGGENLHACELPRPRPPHRNTPAVVELQAWGGLRMYRPAVPSYALEETALIWRLHQSVRHPSLSQAHRRYGITRFPRVHGFSMGLPWVSQGHDCRAMLDGKVSHPSPQGLSKSSSSPLPTLHWRVSDTSNTKCILCPRWSLLSQPSYTWPRSTHALFIFHGECRH